MFFLNNGKSNINCLLNFDFYNTLKISNSDVWTEFKNELNK